MEKRSGEFMKLLPRIRVRYRSIPKSLEKAGVGKEVLKMSRLLSGNANKACHGVHDVLKCELRNERAEGCMLFTRGKAFLDLHPMPDTDHISRDKF